MHTFESRKHELAGSERTGQHESEAGDCTEERKGHCVARLWRRHLVKLAGTSGVIS